MLSNDARRAHRIERARHDLGGACPTGVVGDLGLEQLRVREDDAKLVVEAMKELPQVGLGIRRTRIVSHGALAVTRAVLAQERR